MSGYILSAVDSHLKERLVGAAVLVAAAVILIPEMLSGPQGRNTSGMNPDRPADEAGIKTYTIDLGHSARSGAQENTVDSAPVVEEVVTPAPPPEDEVVTPPPGRAPEKVIPVPTEPAATTEKQPWVVQVGSFANQATAEKLQADLKRRGYASFVVSFKQGVQTLYRVRVGPMQNRNEAEATVQKLKGEGTGAAVVANS